MDVWVGVEIGIGIVTARAEHGPDRQSVKFSCIEIRYELGHQRSAWLS
jgi:hypothetical protein